MHSVYKSIMLKGILIYLHIEMSSDKHTYTYPYTNKYTSHNADD